MPRYFFLLSHGVEFQDVEGEMFADDRAATSAALDVMRETLGSHADHILADGQYTVTVNDEEGDEVCRLNLEGRARR